MIVNGENQTLESEITLLEFVLKLKLNPAMIAVELNGSICPRENWNEVHLTDDDKIELLRFVGGG